jgi:hypothetical protein
MEKSTKKYLQTLKIDSLKIRIPLEEVKIVSSTFLEKFQKVFLTGEIDETVSLENNKTSIKEGITCRIGVVNYRINKDESKEFVYIQANSKMLKSGYLEGITAETIELIYNYIIQENVVFFTLEQFLGSYVSDIDFAYDIEISPETMIKMNQRIFSKVKESKVKLVDKPFRKDSNIGLQFNRREKATPSSPFIKIYHKGVEFKHHSSEFYNFYLKDINLDNYGRLEYTLKSAKHQKHLGVEIKTLRKLITEETIQIMETIVLQGISECYIDSKTSTRDYSKLTPMHKILIFYMESLIKEGYDKEDLFKVLQLFEGKEASDRRDFSRTKILLQNIWELLENGNKKSLKKNAEVNEVLRILKINL